MYHAIIADDEGNALDELLYVIDWQKENVAIDGTASDGEEAVKLIDGRALTECSGNVTRENIQNMIDVGVDYVSSGALTHSAPIMDISLKNLHAI